MLDEFIIANRDAIIARARPRIEARTAPMPTVMELTHGIPMFLDQLVEALREERSADPVPHPEIVSSGGRHGSSLLDMGLSIGQVVHDYGDVCQAITQLAIDAKVAIPSEEFRILNLCLDDAIAGAVTAYAQLRERTITESGTERLGVLAHEMRNLLNTAVLSFDSIQRGQVSATGSTGQVHGRSLMGLRDLIDRSLADVRLDAGTGRSERISVADFLGEAEIGAAIQAQGRAIHFEVTAVDATVTIEGDRQILAAAISNLLQNAFKFSPKMSHVTLRTRTTADRVLFDIKDQCGGLPPGKTEELFRPFEQRSADRSGVGLGLSICRKAAKANGGEIRVRDVPGHGCVFTLDLPRKPPPPLTVIEGGQHPHGSTPTTAGGSDPSGSTRAALRGV
ncbi:MAG: HAMP domain-containing histidine kinase [Polyangiaceae bacterium]|nr:HAMP domain-containing histidine kinase [Polyangiaceae bacterium]